MTKAPQKPAGTFAAHLEAAPQAMSGKRFRLALKAGSTDTPMGFVNVDDGGWCVYAEDGVEFEYTYDNDGKTYLKVASGEWSGNHYLSTSKHGYVGAYKWASADAWKLDGNGRLTDLDADQSLSFYDSGHDSLFAWDEYQPLIVSQV
jgi:hypothetical protein